MSRRLYVKDRRFFQRISSREPSSKHSGLTVALKILLALILLALMAGAVYAGLVYSSEKSIRAAYDGFVQACNEKKYENAIEIYRDTQEKALSTSIFLFHQEARKTTLIQMEEKVNQLVEVPFQALVDQQTPFSDDDLVLINGFQELSNRKITDLTTAYLEEYLLGFHDKERVLNLFSELKKIDTLADMVAKYESSLDQIGAFSETMIAINGKYKEKNYLTAASMAKEHLANQTGFVKDYLNKFYLRCKDEMYPVLKTQIDDMMSGSKYYSAKALIDQMIVFFPDDAYLSAQLDICSANVTQKLVEYLSPVEHISVRPLIANTAEAFDGDSYSKNAEDLMLTADEFRAILLQLYQNNYMLIDINTLVNSSGEKNRLFYPEGKKPLILSIEGLNYYAGRSKSGNSENLSLDGEGHVVSTYTGKNGEKTTDRNGEAIGILEQFIEEHPDFSFDGSKGNISLTGFECIFGYVTDADQVDDRTQAYIDNKLPAFSITPAQISANKEKVIQIISALKKNGWSFSSSTYGNIMIGGSTMEQVQKDTEKWLTQVGSLIGEVKVLLFPSGSIVSSKDERGAYLIQKGFTIQAGIGPWAYFNSSGVHLYMDRIALNGLALRFQDLSRFFDVKTVYDPARKNPLNK